MFTKGWQKYKYNQIRLNGWLSMVGELSHKNWIFWVTLDPSHWSKNENLEKMKKTPVDVHQGLAKIQI